MPGLNDEQTRQGSDMRVTSVAIGILMAAFAPQGQAQLIFENGFEALCELNPDPADPDFFGQACDGTECVFVSPLGSAEGDGSVDLPYLTIGQGIEGALATNKSAVCVASGIYNEDVAVPPGIDLFGGFDPSTFERSTSPAAVFGSGVSTLTYPVLEGTRKLAGFDIQHVIPPVGERTTLALRVLDGDGELQVSHSTILAGDALDGGPGSPGNAPAPAVAPGGNAGSNACTPTCAGSPGAAPVCAFPGGVGGIGGAGSGAGGPGNDSPGGAQGGNGGVGSGSCFVTGASGSDGADGGDLTAQGLPGSGAGTSIWFAAGVPQYGNGTMGLPGLSGRGGGGGGGGAGATCNFTGNNSRGGSGGSGGCGGNGGLAGQGGKGGGSSIGIALLGGSLSLFEVDIFTGRGGNGGSGGNGAMGQAGGTGGSGGGGQSDGGGGAGGSGGDGQSGGAGGPGGGGAGGSSACIVQVEGTSVSGDFGCTRGTPGARGSGGSNPAGGTATDGALGASVDILTIDP